MTATVLKLHEHRKTGLARALEDLIHAAAAREVARIAQGGAIELLEAYHRLRRQVLTEPQARLLYVVRRECASRSRIPRDEALEKFDGRVLPGLFVRGLVQWRRFRGDLYLVAEEP